MIGIYMFTNKVNGKKYIGKSVDIHSRYIAHKRDANKGVDNLLYRAIRKYGIENFDFKVILDLDWLKSYSWEEKKKYMDIWEKFMIRYHNSNNPDYGYNMTSGGDGVAEWTQEMREHNAELSKKLWENENYRERCIQSHKGQIPAIKGKHLKQETKEKLRDINLGKHQSEETRKKQSRAMKGRKPSSKCLEAAKLANTGRPSTIKGKHRVYEDETHTKYHYE